MKKSRLVLLLVTAVLVASAGIAQAALITNVSRTGGNTKTGKPPIGDYDGTTTPLPGMDGGLLDGNGTFSDRNHVWANTPAEVMGAEYIRSMNDDKNMATFQMQVTVSSSCILGLIIDNRVGNEGSIPSDLEARKTLTPNLVAAGMQWVIDMGFVDSGLNIGIDESANQTIDQYFSIYSKMVGPGTYTFYAQNDLTNAGGRNMYCVGAMVPEPMTLTLLALGGFIASRKRS